MFSTTRTRVVALLATAITATPALAETVGQADRAPSTARPLFDLGRVAPPPEPAVFPVKGRVGYGEGQARFGADRGGRRHEGQDVFAPAGSPLVAIRDSRVLETGSDGGRGNYIALYSPERRLTYVYLHMQRPAQVRAGRRIAAGTRVGAVGCTGSCSGDHLHLEVRRGRSLQGKPLDPLPLLRHLAHAR